MLPNFFRGHFPEKMDAISSHLCITSRAVCFPLFPGAILLPSRWNAVHIFPGKSSDKNKTKLRFSWQQRGKCCPIFGPQISHGKLDAISCSSFCTHQGAKLPISSQAHFSYQEGDNAVQILRGKSSHKKGVQFSLPTRGKCCPILAKNISRNNKKDAAKCCPFFPAAILLPSRRECCPKLFWVNLLTNTRSKFVYPEGGNAVRILTGQSSHKNEDDLVYWEGGNAAQYEEEMLPNFLNRILSRNFINLSSWKEEEMLPISCPKIFGTISFWESPLSKHEMLPNLHHKMFAYFIADKKKTKEKCGPIFCPQESVALSCSYFALAKEEDMLPNSSQKIFLLSHCEHFFHQRRRTSWPVLPRRLFCHTF